MIRWLMAFGIWLGLVKVSKRTREPPFSYPICPECKEVCKRVWIDTDVNGAMEYALGAWMCKCKKRSKV